MSRKKVYRKDFRICQNCQWLQRKVHFQYRCNKPLKEFKYSYLKAGYKFVDKQKFLKTEAPEHCQKKLEHIIYIENPEIKE